MNFNISKEFIGIIFILLASLSVALLPNSAKFAFSEGTGMMTLLMARGLIGLFMLTSLLIITGSSFHLPRSLVLISIVNAILALGMIVALYFAIYYIAISLSILILCLFPVVIAIILHFQGLEYVSLIQWIFITLVLIGLSLLILNDDSSISILGIFFSVMGMICAVITTLLSNKLTNQIGALTTTFYLTLWGFIILLLLLFFTNDYSPPQTKLGWVAIFINGTFNIGAWAFFFAGMQRIGATRASMLTSVDPIFAAIIAYILFDQFFSSIQWIGFFLVIVSLVGFEYFKKKI